MAVRGVLAILQTASYPTSMLFLHHRSPFSSLFRLGVAGGIVCIMLGLAPFAVAQDVHHELAVADSDGHEHSDTDICQWVQHHTAGSVDCDVPKLVVCQVARPQELPAESVRLSATLSLIGPSRAPPSL